MKELVQSRATTGFEVHITSTGTDHTYINQSVTSSSSPNFYEISLGSLTVNSISANGASSIDFSNEVISNVAAAVNGGDVVNKTYLDSAISAISVTIPNDFGSLLVNNISANGASSIDFSNEVLSNVAAAVNGGDVVNKTYLDSAISAIVFPNDFGSLTVNNISANGASSIDFSNEVISNVAAAVNGGDVVNKTYLDSAISAIVFPNDFGSLLVNNISANGASSIDFSNEVISNVAAAVNGGDAVNKTYLDSAINNVYGYMPTAGSGLVDTANTFSVNTDGTLISLIDSAVTIPGTFKSSLNSSNVIAAINEISLGDTVYHASTIAEFETALTANADVIFLAPGTYETTSTYTIPENTKIIGIKDKTTFSKSGSGQLFTTTSNYIGLHNLNLESSAGTYIFQPTGNVSNIVVSDCKFTTSGTSGCITSTVYGLTDSKFLNCQFNVTSTTGTVLCLYLGNGTNVVMDSNKFTASISGGTFIGAGFSTNGGTNYITNNHMSCTTSGSTTSCGIYQGTNSTQFVRGNYVKGFTIPMIDASRNSIVESNYLDGGIIQMTSTNAIYQGNNMANAGITITSGDNNFVQGNYFSVANNSAVYIAESNYAVFVKDNVFSNCGNNAIKLYSTSGSACERQIIGNFIEYDFSVTGVNGGLFIDSASTGTLRAKNETLSTHTLSGSVSLNGYDSHIKINPNSRSGDILTIPDIHKDSAGSRLKLESVGTGDFVVTPTTFFNGDSITIDTSGDFIILEWTGIYWRLFENNCANLPAIANTAFALSNIDTISTTRDTVTGVDSRTYNGIFTIRPNTSGTTTTFAVTPTDFVLSSNSDCTVYATGYTSTAGLNNVYGRGNTDGTTSNVFVSFTSTGDSPNVDHLIQIVVNYN